MATTEEEHAVSSTSAGPPNPNVYAILPLKKDWRVPKVASRVSVQCEADNKPIRASAIVDVDVVP